jgi:membrane-associated phospholipid phosphatase
MVAVYSKKSRFRGLTIVQGERSTHNPQKAICALLLISLTCCVSTSWAQEPVNEKPVLGQILSLGAASLLTIGARSLNINQPPAECGPCDPATLPAFDRWAIHHEIDLHSDISDVLIVGLIAGTTADLAAVDGGKAMVASLEAATWTLAVTELSKTIIGRKRPVLYTEDAPRYVHSEESLRSMPSGHTSVAFAVATSYMLMTRGRDDRWPAYLAGAAAVTIGVLRVTGGRHFPSDIVVGAALGVITGGVVHEIRF